MVACIRVGCTQVSTGCTVATNATITTVRVHLLLVLLARRLARWLLLVVMRLVRLSLSLVRWRVVIAAALLVTTTATTSKATALVAVMFITSVKASQR